MQITPIPYYGTVAPGVGYIVFNDFIDKSFVEFKRAMDDLTKNYGVEKLIVDLRSNGGGLIDQAAKIASLFVPNGTEIASIRGKDKRSEHIYRTTEEPLYPDMPLAFIVGENTASSAEILSGAMQDLDRAAVFGTRTFGKGLVQSIRQLPHNGYLKVTTAKYYLPSGRCVQAVDYAQRQNAGRDYAMPDSLTDEFLSAKGRVFLNNSGITPDVECDEQMKVIMERMCLDYGVKLLYHTTVTGVEQEENRIVGLHAYAAGRRFALRANVFIDATGDGNLAAMAGCGYELGEAGSCQPMTLCFRMCNVDTALFKQENGKLNECYVADKENGLIRNPREDVLWFYTTVPGVIHFNTTRVINVDPTDPEELTRAEIEARNQVTEMAAFLKRHFKSFENAEVVMTAARTGVRESRLIHGEYTITEQDILEGRQFESAIARGAYGVDIHNPGGSGTVIAKLPDGVYYTIPENVGYKMTHTLRMTYAGRPLKFWYSRNNLATVYNKEHSPGTTINNTQITFTSDNDFSLCRNFGLELSFSASSRGKTLSYEADATYSLSAGAHLSLLGDKLSINLRYANILYNHRKIHVDNTDWSLTRKDTSSMSRAMLTIAWNFNSGRKIQKADMPTINNPVRQTPTF